MVTDGFVTDTRSRDSLLGHINAEFEYAVLLVSQCVRKLRQLPADRARQLSLCRALREAKLLYKDLLRLYRAPYFAPGRNRLMQAAARGSAMLPPGDHSDVARSIRRHTKEIAEAPRECRAA